MGSQQPWDRPWSTEELISNSEQWSLAGDVALLNSLKLFANNLLEKTRETNNNLNNLNNNLDEASLRLNIAQNRFQSLRNVQFIESRVYEDDETSVGKTGDEKIEEKSEESKNNDIKDAVLKGLQVLDQYLDKVEVPGSDSEEEGESLSFILKPRDLYIERPLPYVIGSDEWQKKWHVGLEDSSSESETEKLSDKFSESDSESELPLTFDHSQIKNTSDTSSELEFSKSSSNTLSISTATTTNNNLNNNNNNNNNNNINDNSKKLLFAGDNSENSSENSVPADAPISNKNFAQQLSEKLGNVIADGANNEVKEPEINQKPIQKSTQPSQYGDAFFDEPPPLFEDRTEKGLFSGGGGLFDDNEEEEGGLWAPKTQFEDKTEKGLFSGGGCLFDDNEEEEGGLWAPKTPDVKPVKTAEPHGRPSTKSGVGLFDDENSSDDDDIFESKKPQSAQAYLKPSPRAPLFSDEPPALDEKKKPVGGVSIFGGSNIFDKKLLRRQPSSDDENDTFESNGNEKEKSKIKQEEIVETSPPQENFEKSPPKLEKKFNLFDDDDDDLFKDDLFSNVTKSKKFTSSLFDDNDNDNDNDNGNDLFSEKSLSSNKVGGLFNDNDNNSSIDIVDNTNSINVDSKVLEGTTEKEGMKKPEKKLAAASLFDKDEDDDDDDLFASLPKFVPKLLPKTNQNTVKSELDINRGSGSPKQLPKSDSPLRDESNADDLFASLPKFVPKSLPKTNQNTVKSELDINRGSGSPKQLPKSDSPLRDEGNADDLFASPLRFEQKTSPKTDQLDTSGSNNSDQLPKLGSPIRDISGSNNSEQLPKLDNPIRGENDTEDFFSSAPKPLPRTDVITTKSELGKKSDQLPKPESTVKDDDFFTSPPKFAPKPLPRTSEIAVKSELDINRVGSSSSNSSSITDHLPKLDSPILDEDDNDDLFASLPKIKTGEIQIKSEIEQDDIDHSFEPISKPIAPIREIKVESPAPKPSVISLFDSPPPLDETDELFSSIKPTSKFDPKKIKNLFESSNSESDEDDLFGTKTKFDKIKPSVNLFDSVPPPDDEWDKEMKSNLDTEQLQKPVIETKPNLIIDDVTEGKPPLLLLGVKSVKSEPILTLSTPAPEIKQPLKDELTPKPGKLKHNLKINVGALMPGAAPPSLRPRDTPPTPTSAPPSGESKINDDELLVATPTDDVAVLQSVTKDRARVPSLNRRPSTRRGRKAALKKSSSSDDFKLPASGVDDDVVVKIAPPVSAPSVSQEPKMADVKIAVVGSDVISHKHTKQMNLFDDDDDDDLFGGGGGGGGGIKKKISTLPAKAVATTVAGNDGSKKKLPVLPAATSKSLFGDDDDEDDDDIFKTPKTVTSQPKGENVIKKERKPISRINTKNLQNQKPDDDPLSALLD